MKKYGIIGAIIVSFVMIGIVGWKLFSGKNDDLSTSLPKDAAMMGRIDFRELASQYGMNADEAGKMMNKILWYSSEEIDGIDYIRQAYVFASQGYFGGIIPLQNADKFVDFVQHSRTCEVESQRGMRWIKNAYPGMLIGVADDRAIVMGPAVGSELDNLRNTIAKLIKQDADESGSQNEIFELMCTRTEPIVLSGSLEALPAQYLPSVFTKYINIPSINMTAGIKLEKNCMSLAMSLSSKDAKTTELLNRIDKMLRPIQGNLLDKTLSKPAIHIEAGINGAKLLEMLRSIPQIRTKLILVNTLFDADLILRNIDGDVAVSASTSLFEHPIYLFQAQMSDTEFSERVNSWNDDITRLAGIRFVANDNKRGRVEWKGEETIFYAVSDDVLRLSLNQNVTNASAFNDIDYAWKNDMLKCKVYATMEASQLTMLQGLPFNIERIVLSATGINEWTLEFVGEDILGKIFDNN